MERKKTTSKRGRIYHRLSSGQTLAYYRKQKLRFFTLTTSDKAKFYDISRDIDVLIKRIRRKQPKFQYCKINTNEGNGVIHLLYTGKYISQKWLSYNWNDIHKSYIVDIRNCDNTLNVASYLVNHYLSNQKCSYVRMSYSKKWLFPGAIKIWQNLFQSIKNTYYYNPIQNKYYKKRIEVPFKQILTQTLNIWNQILYKQTFTQTNLEDYG